MNKRRIIAAILIFFPGVVFAQHYLTEEQEQNIKLSGKYYWDEGSAFDDVKAYHIALNNLTERIISDALFQTKKREEVLKELEMGAHTGRIKQEGMTHVLAWIAKDSVFITSHRPLNPPQESFQLAETPKEPISATRQSNTDNDYNNESQPSSPTIVSSRTSTNNNVGNTVVQELMNCKNYKDVNKVARRHGLVTGEINRMDGFDKPEMCYIAVFDSNWYVVALLGKGTSSRMDLLSEKLIQNPTNQYIKEGYNILYLQQR